MARIANNQPQPLTFLHFDNLRVAHLLSRIETDPGMRADALFERIGEDRVAWSPAERTGPKRALRREQGFAVRLLGPKRSWQDSRDTLDGPAFDDALRRVARSLSSLPMPKLKIDVAEWPPIDNALVHLPKAIEIAVRDRRAGFPFSVQVSHHQRELAIAGPSILAEPQSENFLSFRATLADAHREIIGGLLPLSETSGLSPADREHTSNHIAGLLVERFRAREAASPSASKTTVVMSPHATAVFLHEAVAHALEVDTLSLSGNPREAIGVTLGSELLDVLEDPASAPTSVRRTHDDEGTPTKKRWLLRQGKVSQPIADVAWSEQSSSVDPGCGRRATRHELVGPRSTFLELLPGQASQDDLLAGEGLWLDQVLRGSLEPHTGEVCLVAACGRRFKSGRLSDRVGAFALRGHLADLLSSVTAIGDESQAGGAGWCAKAGQRLPVWARAPSLRLESVEVEPR